VLDGPLFPASSQGGLSGRRGVRFHWDGTLDELCAAPNDAGPWRWFVIGQYRVPFLESHPGDSLWGQIRSEERSRVGFLAVLEAEPETRTGVDELLAVFRSILDGAGATKVAEAEQH
jgi:hypothetical protein